MIPVEQKSLWNHLQTIPTVLRIKRTKKPFQYFLLILHESEKKRILAKVRFEPRITDYFLTVIIITLHSQLCLCRALNSTYFMHYWFCPIRLIPLIRRKSRYFEKLDWLQ